MKNIMHFTKKDLKDMIPSSSEKFNDRVQVAFANISFITVRIKTKDGIKKDFLISQKQIIANAGAYASKTSSRQIHGAAITIDNGKVFFSNHTSKEKFKLGGLTIENIRIDEDSNPIKYTNPILGFDLINFNRYFKVDKRIDFFLKSPRYGKVKEHDLLYFANQAFIKASAHENYIELKATENTLQSIENSIFIYNENNENIYAPAEFEMNETKLNLPEEIINTYKLIGGGSDKDKEAYLKVYKGIHDKILDNFL